MLVRELIKELRKSNPDSEVLTGCEHSSDIGHKAERVAWLDAGTVLFVRDYEWTNLRNDPDYDDEDED